MHRFFRRLRHKLIVEDKFRKYTMYAISEILLFVIRIFIALQLTSWNKERKDKRIIRLLKQLHTDD